MFLVLSCFLGVLTGWQNTLFAAIQRNDIGFENTASTSSVYQVSNVAGEQVLVTVLTLIQTILLKIVLPIILVGASLYIAYQLFTAEGDETKMKKAWKSVAYSAVALIAIALSYGIVSIISRLSF